MSLHEDIIMATVKVACRYCKQTARIIKKGVSSSGKQRYLCRLCGRYFQLDYVYNACKPGVREQIIAMALNSSGINDTVRVLKVGVNTVLRTLKKSEPCTGESKAEKGHQRDHSPC